MTIAFDTSSNSGGIAYGLATFDHTVGSGTGMVLIVGVISDPGGIRMITDNGSSMTLAIQKTFTAYPSDGVVALYYSLAPSSGTHTIIVLSAEADIAITAGIGVSFSGVKQTGFPNTTGTSDDTGTAVSVSLTPTAEHCQIVDHVYANAATWTAGTDQTQHVAQRPNTISSKYLAAAASTTMTQTLPSSMAWRSVSMAMEPISAPVTVIRGLAGRMRLRG